VNQKRSGSAEPSHCVYNLFICAGNRGRWPASVKLVTLPYLT